MALKGNLPIEIPLEIGDISADWFTIMLREQDLLPTSTSVAGISSVEIGAGKGFVALLYRCTLTYDTDDATKDGAPKTVVIKLPNRDASVAVGGSAEAVDAVAVEVPLYSQLLPRVSNIFPRPECYFAAARKGRAVLVLEDMDTYNHDGDREQSSSSSPTPVYTHYNAYVGDQTRSLGKNEARAMVVLAASVHAQSWGFKLSPDERAMLVASIIASSNHTTVGRLAITCLFSGS
jgi:hypothetical protein